LRLQNLNVALQLSVAIFKSCVGKLGTAEVASNFLLLLVTVELVSYPSLVSTLLVQLCEHILMFLRSRIFLGAHGL